MTLTVKEVADALEGAINAASYWAQIYAERMPKPTWEHSCSNPDDPCDGDCADFYYMGLRISKAEEILRRLRGIKE